MPRRILLLITDLEIGGTPTVVRELAVRLAASTRAHVEVACLSPWGPVADLVAQHGIAVTALNARSPADLRILPRLVRLIRDHRIDTLFSFLIHANALAAAAKLLLDPPSASQLSARRTTSRDREGAGCSEGANPLQLRGRCRLRRPRSLTVAARSCTRLIQSIQTTQPTPAWHWRLQGLIHRAADAIVVPTPSVATVARSRSHIPQSKITLIPNAIDPDSFAPSPIPLQSPQPHPYPIGFIGRLDPIKRLPDLLHAIVPLRGRVHLHIFGDGPERPRIESLIEQLNLRPLVSLHGQIPRPHEALQTLGLLVLPSAAEGFGLVLIEAMAAQVPIVARNVPGVRDVVRHNDTALLTPDDSIASLTQTIAKLLDNADLRHRVILRAAEDVASRFSWSTILPQYRALLDI